MFFRYPDWSAELRQHYWHLRAARKFDTARMRSEYRKIAAEKKRLHSAGVDQEVVRLLCRHLANMKNRAAESRFWDAYHQTLQTDFFGSVPDPARDLAA